MKKELSILGGNPQSREEIAHTNPEMFVLLIHRRGMVRFGLWLGPWLLSKSSSEPYNSRHHIRKAPPDCPMGK